MEADCLRHTDFPHTSRLFAEYLYDFERVSGFYDYSPRDGGAFRAAADQVHFPDGRREALVAALRKQNAGNPALDLLARPGTMAVVTGQQVGLFSGPAYTVYKALTAVRLARDFTERGIPSVPVFWLATEDHDFAEVRGCWVFDSSHRAVRLEMSGSGPERSPAGRIEIATSPVEELRAALGSFAFGEEVVAAVERTFVPGRTLGEAFGDLLKELLSGYGMLFVDPMEPGIRELAAPFLRQAADAGPELTELVLERNRALEAAGYHAQVHVERESTLLFALENGRRLPLRRNGGGANSMQAERLSPNALLRPVMQDFILPTVAYVGGPAELAYLAQSQVLYRALLGRMPVVVHRAGFTLLDARSEKLLRRYGLSVPDVFHGEDALRERLAKRLVPEPLERSLSGAAKETEERIGRLRRDVLEFDPTLAAALDTSGRKILYQLSKLERKVAREALRRSTRASEETSYLAGLIYPAKHPQERFYSILPFLARHGFDLIGRIYENVRLDCPDHRILVV